MLSPLQTVRTFGDRPIRPGARLEPVERELSMLLKAVTGAVIVRLDESEVGVTSEDLRQIRRRAQALDLKYDLPVHTTILLTARRRSPATPVASVGGRRGTLTVTVEPRYVRLWEMPPDVLLEGGEVDAIPWVAAMRATPEQEEQMVRAILAVRDPEWRARLSAEAVSLAGMKYDKDGVAEFRQRFSMVTTKEMLAASIIGEEFIEYGRAEGEADSARTFIRDLAADRMPGETDLAWLEQVTDPARLKAIFRALLAARDTEAARAVLAAHRP